MIAKVRSRSIIFLIPMVAMSHASVLLIMGSSFFLGGFFMVSGVAGSSPSAMAGSPSVRRFIHRIWIGRRMGAFSVRNSVAKKMTPISARFETKR